MTGEFMAYGGNLMIIKHNMDAWNANRMFGQTQKAKGKNMEKLSSGYKINRASDDAAGLSISEKMRRQVRGLTQASANSQEGISLVQIADGAMEEVQDMLHRGSELCIKAATGTLTLTDRNYIQMELDQIKREINSIGERTTYNEIPILLGSMPQLVDGDPSIIAVGGLPKWVPVGSKNNLNEEWTTQETYQYVDANGQLATQAIDITHEAATIDFRQFNGSQSQINELIGNGFYSTCCTCTRHYSIRFTGGTSSSMELSGGHFIYNIGIDGAKNASDLIQRIIQGTDNGNPRQHFTKMVDNNGILVVYDDRSNAAYPKVPGTTPGTWVGWKNAQFMIQAREIYGRFGPGVAHSIDDMRDFVRKNQVHIQVGAEAGQHLEIALPFISSFVVGVSQVDARTQDGASAGIVAFKEALEYVSGERSRMGAYQNRLEHIINNLDNVVENTQASESWIRDADVAKSMVEFVTNQVLSQTGQFMLAQSNQNRDGILSLLQ